MGDLLTIASKREVGEGLSRASSMWPAINSAFSVASLYDVGEVEAWLIDVEGLLATIAAGVR